MSDGNPPFIMNLTLRVWRQPAPDARGSIVAYEASDISPDMSFLEMLDVLNEGLILDGQEPVAFDSDCCLLYTSPSPRDRTRSRMPSSA